MYRNWFYSWLELVMRPWEEIAYKVVAVGDDGRLYSVFDGSPWLLGVERHEKIDSRFHKGLFVYRDIRAVGLVFPFGSKLAYAPKVIIKCLVRGNFFMSPSYGTQTVSHKAWTTHNGTCSEDDVIDTTKYAREYVTPLNVERII